MGLTVEFTGPDVTRDEIDAFIKEGRIPFNARFHELQTMPNGNISIFVKNVSIPGLRRKAFGNRKFPTDLMPLYTYRSDIHEVEAFPKEGLYTYGETIESMSVQRVKDTQLGTVKTAVEIVGTDLDKIEQAFMHLRTGKLQPSEEFKSSPGTVEAPKAEEPESKGEGSGSHPLPPTAATATATAA